MYDYHVTVARLIGPLSFHVDIDLGFNVYYHTVVRLDALKQPEGDNRKKAIGFVQQWLKTHPHLTMRSMYNREKYGRWLVLLMSDDDGSVLNSELLSKGLVEHIDNAAINETETIKA